MILARIDILLILAKSIFARIDILLILAKIILARMNISFILAVMVLFRIHISFILAIMVLARTNFISAILSDPTCQISVVRRNYYAEKYIVQGLVKVIRVKGKG